MYGTFVYKTWSFSRENSGKNLPAIHGASAYVGIVEKTGPKLVVYDIVPPTLHRYPYHTS